MVIVRIYENYFNFCLAPRVCEILECNDSPIHKFCALNSNVSNVHCATIGLRTGYDIVLLVYTIFALLRGNFQNDIISTSKIYKIVYIYLANTLQIFFPKSSCYFHCIINILPNHINIRINIFRNRGPFGYVSV